MKIPTSKAIVYGLDDEILENEGQRVHVDDSFKRKYKELVDSYISQLGLGNDLVRIQTQIKSSEGEEFEKLIEKYQEQSGLKKMLSLVRDRALDMSSFPWSDEKGNGIYELKITKRPQSSIYFKDVFDKTSGAVIEDIKQTVEMGRGMGIRAECDEYHISIKNEQKGIACSLEWHH